jgi:acyl-CoA reductase-like NAD-dependent aldehyde dehydrogenase
MIHYNNFIGGSWLPADSGHSYRNANPADTREVVAAYPLSGQADAEAAIDAAKTAYADWAATTPVARGRILGRASQIIETRKIELAAQLTREEGKTHSESLGEIQRTADIFRFFGGLSYQLGGQTIPHDLPNNLLYTRREPLGVVGLITPWNFPAAIPAWKLAPALVCGNTVVLKPASQAPAMALELAKALAEAGLPNGVFNVVIGEGSAVGGELAANPSIVALSFTGSYSVGRSVYLQLAPRMARAQMEMGSKNPTIVLADADLDLAATLAVTAAFGLTGQACTATSRVIVEKSIAPAFTTKLLACAQAVTVGNGMRAGVTMGPAVSDQQLKDNIAHLDSALAEGATLLTGGRRLTEDALAHGHFMSPAVLGGVTLQMRVAREEIFGPVLALMTVDDFDEAIAVANSIDVGLSATLVTRDLKKALLYTERIEAGVVKVNQISTGLALQAPFGGVKRSSTDLFKEQGASAVEFYSKLKTVYLDYSA